jgi:hypothetical protein
LSSTKQRLVILTIGLVVLTNGFWFKVWCFIRDFWTRQNALASWLIIKKGRQMTKIKKRDESHSNTKKQDVKKRGHREK